MIAFPSLSADGQNNESVSERWVISPSLLELKAKAPPHGFNCCSLNKRWNDLLIDAEPPTKNVYTFTVGSVRIPGGGAPLFDRFHIFEHGDLIFREKGFGPIKATFSYDSKAKIMTSNAIYHLLPVGIERLWLPGRHLSNIMAFDMLKDERRIFIHGAALSINGKTFCIFSPGQTGKTTVINMLLQRGAKYIAEDVLITDGRSINLIPPIQPEKIRRLRDKEDVLSSSTVDRAFIWAPGAVNPEKMRERAISFLRMVSNRVPFTNDSLVQALISYHGASYRDLENMAIDVVERFVDNTEVQFIKSMDEITGGLIEY